MALTQLSSDEILQKVKSAIGVGGTYQDDTLTIYIDEVKDFLQSAGVSEEVVNSNRAIGIICRGVTDLWCYGPGQGKLSDYFMQRATQLALETKEGDESDDED